MEKRILVVDDDDAIRTLLFTVLRRRGFKVDVARNGVEAVERCAACAYAVVLLDLMMPRMSGWEVLETLAREPVQTRPVVLVLTAGPEPRNLDTTLVAAMMHKPFDIDLLLNTVSGCLTSLAGRVQTATCPSADSDLRALVRDGTPGDAN
jgi:DNA-binding response OmpR family regulator